MVVDALLLEAGPGADAADVEEEDLDCDSILSHSPRDPPEKTMKGGRFARRPRQRGTVS